MRHTKHLVAALFALLLLQTNTLSHAQIALPAAGIIDTIAGSLNSPGGVAVDRRNGTIYFTDSTSSNRVVKKIDPTTGTVSVYAGGGWFANNSRKVEEPNGTWIYCGPLLNGEGGPATSAQLGTPSALAVDQNGNLYIADQDDNSVFKVTTDGIIHGLVGNGCPVDTGDGGLAANATIGMPVGVAVDTSGNVFISSYLGNYVRKIDTSGIISQYAGGVYGPYSKSTVLPGYCGEGDDAILAQLSSPKGLAVDSNGVLYIADSSNGRIRKVVPGTANSEKCFTPLSGYTPSGYIIEDVTGSLNNPTGLALDTVDNLYISDAGNSRILKMLLSVSNAPIYTIAGNGIAGFTGDGGLAINAELGGSSNLEVSNIALDSNDNLYIGDTTNQRIRAVGASTIMSASCSPNPTAYGSGTTCTATITGTNPTGTITWTINGSAWGIDTLTGSADSISGLSTENGGTYTIQASYSGDTNNPPGVAATILTIKTAQTITFTAPTSPVTYGVAPITLSATATSGLPVTFSIRSGPGQISGNALTITGPGTIVVAANQTGNASYMPAPQVTQSVVANYSLPAHSVITTYAGNGQAGYTGDGGLAANAELKTPFGVAVDSNGNVYIADANNNRIRKLTASTGNISTVAGSGLGGDSVALDASGNFYIANTGSNRALLGRLSNGNIYLIAGNANGTAGYSGDNGAATSSYLHTPQGIAVSKTTGNVYIADTANNRIRMINASTDVITTVAGNGTAGYTGDGSTATSAEISSPYGVAVDSNGNIYFADAANNRIRKVTATTGVISTVAGNGTYGYSGDGGTATSAQLYLPTGVVVDTADNIYIADYGNNRVRMVTASTGIISTVAGNGTAGFSGDNSSATSAALYHPAGVALDASGNLYIADAYNNRVRVIGH
jgi:sugar lactone lactonase YvrE